MERRRNRRTGDELTQRQKFDVQWRLYWVFAPAGAVGGYYLSTTHPGLNIFNIILYVLFGAGGGLCFAEIVGIFVKGD